MDIFSPIIKDDVTITGSSNVNLLRVSSPSNANILFISGSGNVGIGTGTPTQRLHISGSIALTEDIIQQNTNLDMKISGTQTGRAIKLITSANGLRLQAIGSTTSNFILSTTVASSEVQRLAILENGDVGIGTTSPTSRLQVRGSGATSATTALRVENSNASASLVVLDNNNVGIGTSSPTAKLHIDGDTILSGSLYTYGSNSDIDSGSFRTIITVATSSYRAAFFDYVLTSGSNARAGTVFSVWQGTNVEYADTSTNDIGNTIGVNLLVSMSGANIGLFASSSNDNWSMKALARLL